MKLYRGINFGGYLSQCQHTREHYETFITKEDVEKVAKLGFDHVRLPIDYEVLETPEGEDNIEGISFVNQILLWCEEYGLDVVLDLHKAYGYDFNDAGDSQKNNLFTDIDLQKRFTDLWSRTAQRYGHLKYVAFELLNEVVEEENSDTWNNLIDITVKSIRDFAPDTPIIYGGIQWNSARTLQLLTKPIDDNIIYTFHMYEPLIFTHQKAYWVPNMPQDLDMEYPATMEYYKEMSKIIGYKGKDVTVSKCDEMDFGVTGEHYESIAKEMFEIMTN